MTAVLVSSVAVVSFVIGWAARGYRISKRQAERRVMFMELRNPVDLEPSEFSHGWGRK